MTDQPPAQQNNADQPGVAADIFSGVGLGLLLGTVVGLSITPIVTIVVGALTSLLAVFLGLDGGKGDDGAAISKIRLNGVRIGSFGVATVLGIMMGLWIRTHQPFELPLEEHRERWKGFPAAAVHQMVIYERTGIKPDTITYEKGGKEVGVTKTAGAAPSSATLVAGETQGHVCKLLEPGAWDNDPKAILNVYKEQLATDKLYESIHTKVSALENNDQQLQALEAARKLICQLEGDT